MPKMIDDLIAYNGHKIELTEAYAFCITGPEFPEAKHEDRTYLSLYDAKYAIDARVASAQGKT